MLLQETLPDDQALRLMGYLDLPSLCAAGTACKRLLQLEQTFLHRELVKQASPVLLQARKSNH